MEDLFKQRVCETAIACAQIYKTEFLDYNYLVCSKAFTLKPFYIINAHADNFQHLLGVHSLITAKEFFEKSYNGTLSVEDFDFIKPKQDEKVVKGFVRRKIKILFSALNIFHNKSIMVEENFIKNRISCSFATSDNICTLGFENHNYSVPKTLLKSNELDVQKAQPIDLILRKNKSDKLFSEIILGNEETISEYTDTIKDLINISK